MLRPHTELDLDVLDIDRKVTKRPFQGHRFQLHIQQESSGIVKTIPSLEIYFGAASPFWSLGRLSS